MKEFQSKAQNCIIRSLTDFIQPDSVCPRPTALGDKTFTVTAHNKIQHIHPGHQLDDIHRDIYNSDSDYHSKQLYMLPNQDSIGQTLKVTQFANTHIALIPIPRYMTMQANI